jgi:hypothetical protein
MDSARTLQETAGSVTSTVVPKKQLHWRLTNNLEVKMIRAAITIAILGCVTAFIPTSVRASQKTGMKIRFQVSTEFERMESKFGSSFLPDCRVTINNLQSSKQLPPRLCTHSRNLQKYLLKRRYVDVIATALLHELRSEYIIGFCIFSQKFMNVFRRRLNLLTI